MVTTYRKIPRHLHRRNYAPHVPVTEIEPIPRDQDEVEITTKEKAKEILALIKKRIPWK